MPTKEILIIAGPNGAGKTTFATEYLPNEAGRPLFVNADLIAAGLSPFDQDLAAAQAARLMVKKIREHVENNRSFAFETTLSGRRYERLIPEWQEADYQINLIFLQLPTAGFAVQRVAQRVAEGGHNVPQETIRRRYDAGWRNFQEIYKSLVDSWVLYDNSGSPPVIVDQGAKR